MSNTPQTTATSIDMDEMRNGLLERAARVFEHARFDSPEIRREAIELHAILRKIIAAADRQIATPYAYAVHFPDQPSEELVHDLDELTDDLTNRAHTITYLYTATPAPVASDWDVRGHLASSLTCWHRLTAKEAEELVEMAQSLAASDALNAAHAALEAAKNGLLWFIENHPDSYSGADDEMMEQIAAALGMKGGA